MAAEIVSTNQQKKDRSIIVEFELDSQGRLEVYVLNSLHLHDPLVVKIYLVTISNNPSSGDIEND